MGFTYNLKFTHRSHHFTISCIIILISATFHFRMYNVEGRKISQNTVNSKIVTEEKTILRALIGSRPPRCDRRCGSCTHCEAIQVPMNPQIKNGIKNARISVSAIEYARSDDNSNYKPMSWKCKCGNMFFNP